MITEVEIRNFGAIRDFHSNDLKGINLVIGENASGKTFLLKALYSAVKSVEAHNRGDDIKAINEILADKLRWTFQTEKIGDLVTKASNEPLSFRMVLEGMGFSYSFSKDASKNIIKYDSEIENRAENSIFIPAKEVLTLFSVIQRSRQVDMAFGFDDTYLDLVNALSIAPSKGKNFKAFADARETIGELVDGHVEYDESSGKWIYINNNRQRYSIGATSEGIKKISIMDRLFANGYLKRGSIIFIDEIESALHPRAISEFLDVLYNISRQMDIQIFIASHSYFVIRKLYLLAAINNTDISCISFEKAGESEISNLREGMPKNSIIQESVRLYNEEVDAIL